MSKFAVQTNPRVSFLNEWLATHSWWGDMEDMLKWGEPVRTVCDRIIELIGGPDLLPVNTARNTQVLPSTLYEALLKHRASLTTAQLIEGQPNLEAYARKKMLSHISEMEEVQRLYHMQIDRIDRHASVERKMGFPIKQLSGDIAVAADLVKLHAEMRLKMIPVSSSAEPTQTALVMTQRTSASIGPIENPEFRATAVDLIRRLSRIDDKIGIAKAIEIVDET